MTQQEESQWLDMVATLRDVVRTVRAIALAVATIAGAVAAALGGMALQQRPPTAEVSVPALAAPAEIGDTTSTGE